MESDKIIPRHTVRYSELSPVVHVSAIFDELLNLFVTTDARCNQKFTIAIVFDQTRMVHLGLQIKLE